MTTRILTNTQSVVRLDAMLAMCLAPNTQALDRFMDTIGKVKIARLRGILSPDDVDEMSGLLWQYKLNLTLEQEMSWDGKDPERDYIDNRGKIEDIDITLELLKRI